MQKWIMMLSGLLLAQLVLAVAVNLGGEDYGAFQAKEPLLVFDTQAVDGVRIETQDSSLLLRKQTDRWLLPEAGDFPADQQNVQGLLEKLAGLQKGWPVATTSSAVRRFQVADDAYQTRISLMAEDDVLQQLYIGTSPGFRKVHVRPAQAEAVFSVAFNTWEASAKADEWIDKQILALEQDAVTRIELADVLLQRQEQALQVAQLTDREQTNQEAVTNLLTKLTGLRVQSLLGSEAKPAYRQDAPVLEVKLARQEGEPLTYRFSKPEQGDYYVLKRSDLDYYFEIPEFSVEPILQAKREKLVLSESAQTAEETATEGQDVSETPLGKSERNQ
jgi:hypothetical protein